MPRDNFLQRKNAVFSKNDKSSKGNWDEKIKSLCEKINRKENYFTTSSCSGRIVLMIEQDKKSEGLFKFVSHDLINFEKLKGELEKILKFNKLRSQNARELSDSETDICQVSSLKHKINVKDSTRFINDDLISLNKNLDIGNKIKDSNSTNIKFKQEPCIVHVACRNLEDAFLILNKAQKVGWKRSGIISEGNVFSVELLSTEKLEFPIIVNGKLIVDDNFLKIVVEKSNENLKKCWEKIRKLEKEIK